jgi:hypothetical protein
MLLNISDRTNLNRAGIWELGYSYANFDASLLTFPFIISACMHIHIHVCLEWLFMGRRLHQHHPAIMVQQLLTSFAWVSSPCGTELFLVSMCWKKAGSFASFGHSSQTISLEWSLVQVGWYSWESGGTEAIASARGHGWQRIIVFCRNFTLSSRLFTKYINFSFLFSIKSALLIVFIHVISIRIAVCFVVQTQICLYNQHIIHLSTIHTTYIFGFFLIRPSDFMCWQKRRRQQPE